MYKFTYFIWFTL